MRAALRRILWILPTLFVISLGTFWLLSAAGGFRPAEHEGHDADEHPLFGPHDPPRFFNKTPTTVRDLALRAMAAIARDDEHSQAAKIELARLGGATLPFVLPELDTLDPKGRARVAIALAPIGKRMGVGTTDELSSPETAVLFWTRFWQDRAIEFRPPVAKRAVDRLSEKATAGRRDDVFQLDTYALPALMATLGPIDGDDDVKRARRLTAVLARITELDWKIPADANVADARRVTLRWERWWLEHSADYSTFDGAERLLAMVSETQYGHWIAEAAQNRLGVSSSGEPVLDVFRARAPVTAWLLASGLVGGYLTGIFLGLIGAAWAHKARDLVTALLAIVIASIPATVLSTLAAPAAAFGARRFAGALVMILVSSAIVSRHQRAATRVALDQEYTRTARAFGAGPGRLAIWSLRASSVASLSLIGVDLTTLITIAFVVEHGLGLPGLASPTLLAVTSHDIAWLMAISLVSTAVLSLTQVLSDALLSALDPRVRIGFLRKRGLVE